MSTVQSANAEAIEAWDGPLFERFVRYRHTLVAGLVGHGDAAIAAHPPARGDRVLDVGCGFGDMSRQLAELVGPEGEVVGVDASPRFVEAAAREAREAGVTNAAFAVADVEVDPLGERFDRVYSRFGTMFFANPVAALRNIRRALVPGGELTMVVWRAKAENPWAMRGQEIVERFVTKPEQYDDPTCGPGPFSLGNADTVSGILVSAGFEAVTLRRCDLPITAGRNLDEAVDLVMSIGPAGEILRLQGDRAAHLHAPISEALHEGMAEWVAGDGSVIGPASTWIVSAATRRP